MPQRCPRRSVRPLRKKMRHPSTMVPHSRTDTRKYGQNGRTTIRARSRPPSRSPRRPRQKTPHRTILPKKHRRSLKPFQQGRSRKTPYRTSRRPTDRIPTSRRSLSRKRRALPPVPSLWQGNRPTAGKALTKTWGRIRSLQHPSPPPNRRKNRLRRRPAARNLRALRRSARYPRLHRLKNTSGRLPPAR